MNFPMLFVKESMPTLISFPEEYIISSYLQLHPLSGNENGFYLKDNKVHDAVAKQFATRKVSVEDLNKKIGFLLHDYNLKLKWSDEDFKLIQMVLIAALKDCSNRNISILIHAQNTQIISKL